MVFTSRASNASSAAGERSAVSPWVVSGGESEMISGAGTTAQLVVAQGVEFHLGARAQQAVSEHEFIVGVDIVDGTGTGGAWHATGSLFRAEHGVELLPIPALITDPNSGVGGDELENVLQVSKRLLGEDVEVVRARLCFRPVTGEGRPVVAEVKAGMAGVWVVAGHGPWGVSLSLGTGKVMAEMMAEMIAGLEADVDGIMFEELELPT
ncbi:hypothetical protein DFP73DRAFT_590081 [Morchella snyderi]|nr:hypothetical protein DFP73DRAFT_590081 [Morchella snyderi]